MLRNAIITVSYILLILFASAFAFHYGYQRERIGTDIQQPFAENGIIDFTEIDFKKQGFARLKGEYEFYWNQLLEPTDFKSKVKPDLTGYIRLPGLWNGFKVDGEELKGKGYASFRLKIKVKKDDWYGIKIKEFDCAYKIWVNDSIVANVGKVGTDKKSMIPSWERKEIYFTSVNKEINIILQVSNFQHRKGGPEDAMLFGPAKNIIIYKNQQLAIGLFLFGILMIMSIYHLVLYIYRRKDMSIIYFSALCFVMTFRLITTGEKILIEVFPNINWAFAVRIEYLSYQLAVPIFIAFLHSIFPKDFSYKLVRVVTVVALVFAAFVIFTPVSIFSYTPLVYQVFLIAVALYAIIVLIITMLRKREYSWLLFAGCFFFFLVIINDLLYYNKFLETSFLIPFGLFVMIFTQAFVLSKKTSKAFIEVESLTYKMDNYSRELEQNVKDRTSEIITQKDKIKKQKEEIENQADNLKRINEKLIEVDKFKENMTNMMVHDLKNPLSAIIGFSALEASKNNFNHIHQSGRQMLQLVSNILDVYKYENTEMKISKEKEFLYEMADDAFEKSKYQIIKKIITFKNQIPKDHVVNIDKEIIERVFINIFSNAIKYIKQEGVIEASSELITEAENDFFKVSIFNSGESIPSDKLITIFEKYSQLNPKKSGISYSTGIGLAFCKLAIEAHNGTIGAFSKDNEGVTFWFSLEM